MGRTITAATVTWLAFAYAPYAVDAASHHHAAAWMPSGSSGLKPRQYLGTGSASLLFSPSNRFGGFMPMPLVRIEYDLATGSSRA